MPTGEGCFTVSESTGTRWWQLKYFLFSTLPGEIIQFDSYFWKMGWFNHQVGKVVAFQHVERNSGDVKMVDSKRALFPENCLSVLKFIPHISLYILREDYTIPPSHAANFLSLSLGEKEVHMVSFQTKR